MSIDVPNKEDITRISQNRDPNSITIYIGAEGIGERLIVFNVDAAQIAFRDALRSGLEDLEAAGLSRDDRDKLEQRGKAVLADGDLWHSSARSVAIFLAPDTTETFRLMNQLRTESTTGDRFDFGPLLRARAFENTGYVLALTEGQARLVHLSSAATVQNVDLRSLPENASEQVERETRENPGARHRDGGAAGPKPILDRYAAEVHAAVRSAIGADGPVILAADNDLESAYREVAGKDVLDAGITANPSNFDDEELEKRGRAILDEVYEKSLAEWREKFGTRQAHDEGSSDLDEVAKYAWQGRVEELFFDIDSEDEGTIDDFGTITLVQGEGPDTYRVVDEIAAQVLRTGGTVRAVRRGDLPADSPVAATFRG